MRYLDIAQRIREQIALGRVAAGGALASESDLARRHRVSRMTVRKALETLRGEGLLTSRKGAGWFVALDPVRQTLGRFDTIESALATTGAQWERRVLEFRFEPADDHVADALELPKGAEVLRVRRLNLADGEPFAIVTVWVPAELGATLSRKDVERSTFYDLLPLHGVRLRSAVQTIAATVASPDDARLLGVPRASALLVCKRLTRDVAGRPVIAAEHRYAAHRTVFEVEFPSVGAAAADGPSGLRLVEGGTS
jgi:GntR family transcriptional regulator